MRLRTATRVASAVLVPMSLAAGLLPVHASQPGAHLGRPATYVLTGDPGGSKFEGIGVTRNQRTFYVSEVTGGEIHRGDVVTGVTEEWLPEGEDGRFTARGITTDAAGRVYIAGGPNGLGTGRPDVWVYDADGSLLAALRVPTDNAFVNDVAIGPDGAAYFTNSNAPQIFRVGARSGTWTASLWADASDVIDQQPGFNLGGIVVSRDGRPWSWRRATSVRCGASPWPPARLSGSRSRRLTWSTPTGWCYAVADSSWCGTSPSGSPPSR